MGFMTTIIFFLNDAYEEIQKYPDEVIKNILDAMRNTTEKTKTYSIGNYVNPMLAFKTEHADAYRLFYVHGNSGVEIGFNNDARSLEYRKKVLKIVKEIIKFEQEEIKKLEEEQKKQLKR